MLNEKLKLHPDVFLKTPEEQPTRDGYGTGLILAGEQDKNVVVLTADLEESTRAEGFANKFPNRFFELGVAEQNLATVAAGLGVSGKIPFISSYAVFSPGRNWEQIRTTISCNNANVKVAGHHAGLSVGPDGATHQALEDMALMSTLPNMKIFSPCDAHQAEKATLAAAQTWGPVYLRLAREKTPLITTPETPFLPGKLQDLWRGKKPAVAIIATGPLVHEALLAAQELSRQKIDVVVANCHTLAPLDEEGILELARKIGALVTVEEHQVRGGLGGAVAELLAARRPAPMEFVGVQNQFGESGKTKELWVKYGLSAHHIASAVRRAARRKR